MEEQGLRQADIAAIVGGKNRATEILSRKRVDVDTGQGLDSAS